MTDISLADYHRIDAVSNGRIGALLENPAVYHAKYNLPPDHVDHIEDDSTKATLFGSAFHAWMLDGEEAFNRCTREWAGGLTKGRTLKDGTIAPGSQKPTMNKNSEAYEEFSAGCERDNVIEISASDRVAFRRMQRALEENDEASALLFDSDGINEQTLLWNELGLPAKARPDRIIRAPGRILVDLKTTMALTFADVERFAIKHGYHRQAAWYCRGYAATHGEAPAAFRFVSVRPVKPYLVWTWEFDAATEALAQTEIDEALAELVGRRSTNDWTPDECRTIQVAGHKPWDVSERMRIAMERNAA